MPLKDPTAKRAYQREWYARPGNRERTIAAVAERKHSLYAGVCRNCGGPTVGSSKNQIPEWCSKPACKSAQRKQRWAQEHPPQKLSSPAKKPATKASESAVSRYFQRPKKKK